MFNRVARRAGWRDLVSDRRDHRSDSAVDRGGVGRRRNGYRLAANGIPRLDTIGSHTLGSLGIQVGWRTRDWSSAVVMGNIPMNGSRLTLHCFTPSSWC